MLSLTDTKIETKKARLNGIGGNGDVGATKVSVQSSTSTCLAFMVLIYTQLACSSGASEATTSTNPARGDAPSTARELPTGEDCS